MKHSLIELFRTLLRDVRALLRQELLLIKTEMSEKISRLGRNAMALAIGGSAAYAGMIVLLMGFGLLLAWAFSILGMPSLLAGFLGLAVTGILVSGGGALVLFKALHAISKQSLVPGKSVEALHHLSEVRNGGAIVEVPAPGVKLESTLSSEELKKVTFATEEALDKTLVELQARLSPRQIAHRVRERVVSHPVRFAVAVAGAGAAIAGVIFARRRMRHP